MSRLQDHDPTATTGSERKRRRRLEPVLVGAFLAAFLIVGWQTRRPLAIRGSDELIYLSLSHSLESGSYQDTYLVGSPPHIKYPPAYPAWLIPIRHLTGENLDQIVFVNLILAAGALLILYLVARLLIGKGPALGLLFLLAANISVSDWTGSLMSEGLFLWLSTLSLGLAFWADRSGKSAVSAFVAGWLAFLTRTAGLALIAGLAVWLWQRRRRSEWLAFGLGSAVIVGGWFAYTWLAAGNPLGTSYRDDLGVLGNEMHEGGSSSIVVRTVTLFSRTAATGLTYLTQTLPSSVALPTIEGTIVDNLLWLGITLGLGILGLVSLWRSWRPAAVYLALYAGMLIAWPWADTRLLMSGLPLLLLTLVAGGVQLVRWRPGMALNLIVTILFALAAVGALQGTIKRLQQRSKCDRTDPIHSPGCHSPNIRSFVAGAEFIRKVSSPQDVVLTSEPVTVNFLTGRVTVPSRLVLSQPAGKLAERLEGLGVRYVLLYSGRPADRGAVGKALLASCRDLRFADAFEPTTLVLSFPAAGEQLPDGCAALTRFLEATRSIDDPLP